MQMLKWCRKKQDQASPRLIWSSRAHGVTGTHWTTRPYRTATLPERGTKPRGGQNSWQRIEPCNRRQRSCQTTRMWPLICEASTSGSTCREQHWPRHEGAQRPALTSGSNAESHQTASEWRGVQLVRRTGKRSRGMLTSGGNAARGHWDVALSAEEQRTPRGPGDG